MIYIVLYCKAAVQKCYHLNHLEGIYAKGKTGLKMTCPCWFLSVDFTSSL